MIPVFLAAFLPVAARAETAIFAGGCFWCMESEFQELAGVRDVKAGYAGGTKPDPTYEEVSRGDSGYKEAIEVTYDPSIVSYEKLLDVFWSNVDPFDDKGQFCDKGDQYVAAIFTETDGQKKAAEVSLKKVEEKFGRPVATQILPKTTFYMAEDNHQDFYKKNPDHYERYKNGCGRDRILGNIWGEKRK